MPGRPSTHPKVSWNSITNRWEITSKSGRLEMAIESPYRRPARFISFIGSMAAVNGSNGNPLVLGTITNATGLQVGDMVFVTPASLPLLGAIYSPSVPTNNLLNIAVQGSVPAIGVNVFAIRTVAS